jgi:hypothetical protein
MIAPMKNTPASRLAIVGLSRFMMIHLQNVFDQYLARQRQDPGCEWIGLSFLSHWFNPSPQHYAESAAYGIWVLPPIRSIVSAILSPLYWVASAAAAAVNCGGQLLLRKSMTFVAKYLSARACIAASACA